MRSAVEGSDEDAIVRPPDEHEVQHAPDTQQSVVPQQAVVVQQVVVAQQV